jgi:hypothetical protein
MPRKQLALSQAIIVPIASFLLQQLVVVLFLPDFQWLKQAGAVLGPKKPKHLQQGLMY